MRECYTVHAQRDGAWWAIEVEGVTNAFSQAKRIDQIEAMAREVVSLLLDVEPDSFDLTLDVVVPPDWAEQVQDLRARQAAAEAADRAASARLREVAAFLKGNGLPVRDVGSIMGVSPQRVSQLLTG